MSQIYWKQKNGELISVDNMDINHLKNALKRLIQHHQNVVQQTNEIVDKYNSLIKIKRKTKNSILIGDAANLFNESYTSNENYYEDLEINQDIIEQI